MNRDESGCLTAWMLGLVVDEGVENGGVCVANRLMRDI
jgi:hypothetical protein